jgi:hypothetical protein
MYLIFYIFCLNSRSSCQPFFNYGANGSFSKTSHCAPLPPKKEKKIKLETPAVKA